MTQEKRVEAALKIALRNPYWKDVYEKAPSENCKRFIALEYSWSVYNDDEDLAAMIELERCLTKEDFEYRLSRAGSGYERNAIREKMKQFHMISS